MTDALYFVYLLHATNAANSRIHYLGSVKAEHLDRRLHAHKNGYGATHTKFQWDKGAQWHVARLWQCPDRTTEKALKRGHRLRKLCPICQGQEPEPSHTQRPEVLYKPFGW